MPSQNEGESLTLKEVRDLLYKAAHEFSRIKALAWAADQLLCDSGDATIDHLELGSRISYIIQVIVEKAGNECLYFDTEASKVNGLMFPR